jgi:hypothetical protein
VPRPNRLTEIERMHKHPRAIPNRWKVLAAALPITEEDEIMKSWLEHQASRTEEEKEAERAMWASAFATKH